MFRDLQREQTIFTDLVAHRGFGASVTWRGRPFAEVQGMEVSGSYFPTLGSVRALGRLFGPEVDEPIGGHPVAVLSHEFWQDDLGGARDVLRDALIVNGQVLTVVGVAPAGFRGTTLNMPSMIFVPITMHARLAPDVGEGRFEDRRQYWLYLFARLKPAVSIVQARAAIAPLYRNILTDVETPLQKDMSDETLARFVAKPLPIEDGRRGQSNMHDFVGVPLLLLLGITGAVLLIACANIANLLLARSAARTSEMAVRLSLGATRRHLVTQLLTESCLLAVLGGAAGLVERVTFHNPDSGFCVLRVKARSHRDLVTVVGHAAMVAAGEWITASGEWVNDRTHGQQFKARFLRSSAPSSIEGIEKYLGSGMTRGIGPVYARKLVRAFGEEVFDVIEAEPERLREVNGIGRVRAGRITDAWAEQKVVREIMVFPHSHGVGTARAVRIFRTYGADAIEVMSENPYRLARDIRGIGFKTADAIAMKLGITKTAMIRVRPGIGYAPELRGTAQTAASACRSV